METIKSIIFDWGGVLIDDPAPDRAQYFAELLGTSAVVFEQAFDRFGPDFQKGLISEGMFWDSMCDFLRVPKPDIESSWLRGFEAGCREKVEVFELASLLRRNGYKTAVVSNTEAPAVEYFHSQRYDMFDVRVFSCCVHAVKPDREIYEIAMDKLNCEPEQSVFIDDKAAYITGAKTVGINTILFRSFEQLKNELSTLGVIQKM